MFADPQPAPRPPSSIQHPLLIDLTADDDEDEEAEALQLMCDVTVISVIIRGFQQGVDTATFPQPPVVKVEPTVDDESDTKVFTSEEIAEDTTLPTTGDPGELYDGVPIAGTIKEVHAVLEKHEMDGELFLRTITADKVWEWRRKLNAGSFLEAWRNYVIHVSIYILLSDANGNVAPLFRSCNTTASNPRVIRVYH